MPTITLDVPDELADGLNAAAQCRGHATPAALLTEVAVDLAHGADWWDVDAPEPPPEVLAEVRRRQETPLSECRPAEEYFDELETRIKARIAADAARVPQELGA